MKQECREIVMYQTVAKEITSKIADIDKRHSKMEESIEKLVRTLNEEATNRRILDERLVNALEIMGAVRTKVDKHTEAIHIMEKKIVSLEAETKDIESLKKKQEDSSDAINTLKNATNNNGKFVNNIERVVWIVFAAVVAFISDIFGGE